MLLPVHLLGTVAGSAPGSDAGGHEKWVKGQILVKPRAGSRRCWLPQDSTSNIPEINVHIISVPPGAEDKVIKALSHNPNIEFAQDLYLQPDDYTPNDPKFAAAWALQL